MKQKLDIDNYVKARKSDINLDTGLYSGDIGLGGDYYIKELYSDLILIAYVDVNNSGQREEDGLIVPTLTNDLHWRKGLVLLVGPDACHTNPGDYVCFPNDKGLQTANVNYMQGDKLYSASNAIFLDERRIFANLGIVKMLRKDQLSSFVQ